MEKSGADRVRHLLTLGEGYPSLGPETRAGALSIQELNGLMNAIFAEEKVDSARQQLIRAIVLLWHDHLEESHGISQNIQGADGSYAHGIMHRREPDYGNAKYWFHRVGNHPAAEATGNSFEFIDAVEEARQTKDSAAERRLNLRQSAEIIALLDHVLAHG